MIYTKELPEVKEDIGTGYLYFIDKGHPLSTGNSGRVYLHRHNASVTINRWLTTDEHVHHKDENKHNNSVENLEILTAKEHTKLHNPRNNFVTKCNNCGIEIIYGKETRIPKSCSVECRIEHSIVLKGVSKEDLEFLIWTINSSNLSIRFNCSDVSIRKWAKRLGCLLPPPYFHNKVINNSDKLLAYNSAKTAG